MCYNSKLCTYAWKEQGSSLYLIVIQWAQVVCAWYIQLKPESGGCIYQQTTSAYGITTINTAVH